MNEEKEEIDEKTIIDNIRATNELCFNQYSEALNQKNTWLIQLITIAGAIFGGIILSQQRQTLTVNIGLAVLFTVVFVGITIIYRENKNRIKLIQKAYSKTMDYLINLSNYNNLYKKRSLTKPEIESKQRSQEHIDNFLKETGLSKGDGTLGSLYEKYEKLEYEKIDWNYLLILGYFISILIIIFPNYFETMWHWLMIILLACI